MSLSGWKSLRILLCFVGSVPAVRTGTEGTGLAATPWCGVFFSRASLHFLQLRVSTKPSASTEWASPDTVVWLSEGMKKPWVNEALWGCGTLRGASGTPLMGVCLSGCSWCGLQDCRVSEGQLYLFLHKGDPSLAFCPLLPMLGTLFLSFPGEKLLLYLTWEMPVLQSRHCGSRDLSECDSLGF